MVGSNLSHYKIVAEIGRGGMGIVYKAEDTKLNRSVALKVLPAAALASEDDRARFFREAQAAAQLSHPNIATVFQIDEAIPMDEKGDEVGASDGPRPFIAMEFIEGETLHDIVRKGPLKLPEAVRIATQVAEALKAAHGKSIVHRDIKSANVMLTGEGVAKVLDFGLAKTNQSTMLTRMGSTLGTVAYMSPEQARGQEVDGRSDLYSLGTMLYEMIAGRLPFAGEYEQAVVYSILNEMPESLTAVRTGVPMGLEWIVNKLVSKEPRHRYQTAADLIADLETVDLSGSGHSRRSMAAASAAGLAPAPSVEKSRGVPKWIWGVMILIGLLGGAFGWLVPRTDTADPVRYFVVPIGSQRIVTNSVDISEDGRAVVAAVTGEDGLDLLVKFNDEPESRILKVNANWIYTPKLSPDARYVAYFSQAGLFRIPVTAGSPEKLYDDDPNGEFGWISSDELILFPNDQADERQIGIVSPNRTTWLDHTIPENPYYASPRFISDHEVVMFSSMRNAEGEVSLQVLNIRTGATAVISERASAGAWHPDGYVVFYRDGGLHAARFNPTTFETRNSFPVLSGVVSNAAQNQVGYALSKDGSLVYQPARDQVNDDQELGIFTPASNSWEVLMKAPEFHDARLSPDGRFILSGIRTDGSDVWKTDLQLGTMERLTNDPREDETGTWHPSGDHFFFVGSSNEGDVIVRQSIANSLERDTVYVAAGHAHIEAISPDGESLVLMLQQNGNRGLWKLPADGNQDIALLVDGPQDEYGGVISPDGNWIAFVSDESGAPEVYVRAWPEMTGQRRLSADGGVGPRWGADSRHLFYRKEDALMNIPFGPAGPGQAETVAALDNTFLFDGVHNTYDVVGNGETFLMARDLTNDDSRREVRIITGFGTLLRQLDPDTE